MKNKPIIFCSEKPDMNLCEENQVWKFQSFSTDLFRISNPLLELMGYLRMTYMHNLFYIIIEICQINCRNSLVWKKITCVTWKPSGTAGNLTHCGLVMPYGDIDQVMAYCLVIPSHYVNQCWLIMNGVLWHSCKIKFTRRYQFETWVWKIHL